MGVGVGGDKMLCGGLACRIGTARVEWRLLVEAYTRGGASINFVGADMDKPNSGKTTRHLQQTVGAQNIGAQKRGSILNAAVHVGLRRKVDDCVKLPAEKIGNGSPVGDVAPNEGVPSVVRDVGQILRVARVGQLVESDDFHVAARVQQETNEISADKACTTRDQNSQSLPSFLIIRT